METSYYRTRLDQPWNTSSLLYSGWLRSFPRVKRLERGADHTHLPIVEVKERVDIYVYSSSGSSLPFLDSNLPFHLYLWSEIKLNVFSGFKKNRQTEAKEKTSRLIYRFPPRCKWVRRSCRISRSLYWYSVFDVSANYIGTSSFPHLQMVLIFCPGNSGTTIFSRVNIPEERKSQVSLHKFGGNDVTLI